MALPVRFIIAYTQDYRRYLEDGNLILAGLCTFKFKIGSHLTLLVLIDYDTAKFPNLKEAGPSFRFSKKS